MGYLFRRKVTIDHTKVGATNSSNFPMLFGGTYAYLATAANGGKITNASGFDIILTSDAAGATKLDHEIESYASSSGALNFWVRIPTLSHTADTVIYLWYGNSSISSSQENATGVWDTNYKLVYHLTQTTGHFLDSTSNANNSTAETVTTRGAASQIGTGAGMTTSGDSVTFPALSWGSGAWTVSMWVKRSSGGGQLFLQPDSFGRNPGMSLTDNNGNSQFEVDLSLNGSRLATGVAVVGTTWTHIFWSYPNNTNVGNGSCYVNGSLDTSAAFADMSQGTPSAGTLGGALATYDEFRFSNVARSADWLTAEYNNQNSPSTFYTIGPEEIMFPWLLDQNPLHPGFDRVIGY